MALFKNRKVFIFILLVIGLVGFLLAGLQSESNGNRSQTVVRTFPVVSTTLLNGQSIESVNSLLDNEYQL
ncbi:disulfide bond formation protein DsbE, partial [Vibrio xuii]